MRELKEIEYIFNTTEATGPETDCQNRKYLVYQCHGSCGGLGDRQKGMVSTYLLAKLTRRTFIVDMTFPCTINMFLQPNKYNWLTCKRFLQKVSKADTTEYLTIDNKNIYEKEFTSSDIRYSWAEKVVKISINWYAIDIIRYYLNYNRIPELEWIRYRRNEYVVQRVLDVLFTPHKTVLEKVDTFINRYVGKKMLVCGHLRVGKNPSLPGDEDFGSIRGHPDLDRIIRFLSVYNNSYTSAVYVATDSEYVRKWSAQRLTNFVNLNRTVLHIDRFKVSNKLGCVGFYNAVTEQILLTKCDVLVLTMSNFGIISALMRNKSKGLYTYLTKDNTIVNATAWTLFDNFDPY